MKHFKPLAAELENKALAPVPSALKYCTDVSSDTSIASRLPNVPVHRSAKVNEDVEYSSIGSTYFTGSAVQSLIDDSVGVAGQYKKQPPCSRFQI